jgi:undecaprenyl-diphosphatase
VRIESIPSRRTALAGGWLACLVAFGLIAVAAAGATATSSQVEVIRAVQELPRAIGHLLEGVSWLGGGWPLALITCGAATWLAVNRHLPEAMLVFASFLPRAAVSLLKEVVESERPLAWLVAVREDVATYAFPSGHVAGTAITFVALFVVSRQLAHDNASAVWLLRAWCAAMVALIGVARMWLGVHWPLDVAGGYLLAALWLIPAVATYRYLAADTDRP